MSLQTTAEDLPNWARRGSELERADSEGALCEHFPEQTVESAEGLCDPSTASSVLSFRDGGLYYLLRGGDGSYALIRRGVDDERGVAVIGGFFTGILTWCMAGLIAANFVDIHNKTPAETPVFGALMFVSLFVLPTLSVLLFRRLFGQVKLARPNLSSFLTVRRTP